MMFLMGMIDGDEWVISGIIYEIIKHWNWVNRKSNDREDWLEVLSKEKWCRNIIVSKRLGFETYRNISEPQILDSSVCF